MLIMSEEMERHPSDDEPMSALAFKIATDPFVGRLCIYKSLLRHNEKLVHMY